MKFITHFLFVTFFSLIGGCVTMPITPRYIVSTKNIVELRDLYSNSSNKLRVGKFTSEIKNVKCRGEEIRLPDGLTLTSFVKNSFSDELKLAGVYSDKSNVEVCGRIINFNVECNIGTAKWITEIEVSMGSNIFTIKNIYSFEGAFNAFVIYKNAQQTLTPALQDLFWLIIRHPTFKMTLEAPKYVPHVTRDNLYYLRPEKYLPITNQ